MIPGAHPSTLSISLGGLPFPSPLRVLARQAPARERVPGFALLLPAIKWLVKEMQVSVRNASGAATAGGDAL